jgi:small subunit ribosomal protein S5
MARLCTKTRRKVRVSGKLRAANSDKLRISVAKTNKHIYLQLIDDVDSHTVIFVSTNTPEFKMDNPGAETWCNIRCASKLGEIFTDKLAGLGTEPESICVYFDRGGAAYAGVVKAVADSLRSCGFLF